MIAEAAANKAFLEEDLAFDSDSNSESANDSNPDEPESDDSTSSQGSEGSIRLPRKQARGFNGLIATSSTSYAREKLIRILNGDVLVPKQRWGIDKILATLTYHRKDKRLRLFYRQFKQFAFCTLLQESDRTSGQLPGALTQKDWDLIIKLQGKSELEKRYRQEIQGLYKTPCFGAVKTKPGVIDKHLLNDIVKVSINKAPLVSSLVFNVGPTSSLLTSDSHLVKMKVVAVLVILCHSAHQNNTTFFPLFIALYMYSAGAKVDAITLLNHLGLSVLYKSLQKRLNDITSTSKLWIKEQANNCQLVSTWDNFEFRENVQAERVGDIVKFRSITMALWIQKGWQISVDRLNQTM